MTEKIGRYKLIKMLGSNHMVSYYQGQSGNISVFIKQLHEHLAQDEIIRERFLREFRITTTLNHPAIVRSFELTETDNRPAIICEYINGKSLGEINFENFDNILNVTTQITEALIYTHQQGIIHRMIHPENILITDNGKIRITDFGQAHISNLIGLTTTTMFTISPEYTAPELMQGCTIDPRSDFFSLGVVLYEILFDSYPRSGDLTGDNNTSILNLKPEIRDVPDWFLLIVAGLLKPINIRIFSGEKLLDLLQQKTAPLETNHRLCVFCRNETPQSIPVCIHCARQAIPLDYYEGMDAVSVRLVRLSEADDVMAEFYFIIRALSGDNSLSPNILTGDIRLYSKAEKERGYKLPVRIIDNLKPEIANKIMKLVNNIKLKTHKKISFDKKITSKINKKRVKGPIIPNHTNLIQADLTRLKTMVKAYQQMERDPATDMLTEIIASLFRLEQIINREAINTGQNLPLNMVFRTIKSLTTECQQIKKFLENITLGETYMHMQRIERQIKISDSVSETNRLIDQKTKLKEVFNKYRESEIKAAALISKINQIRQLLDLTCTRLNRTALKEEQYAIMSDTGFALNKLTK